MTCCQKHKFTTTKSLVFQSVAHGCEASSGLLFPPSRPSQHLHWPGRVHARREEHTVRRSTQRLQCTSRCARPRASTCGSAVLTESKHRHFINREGGGGGQGFHLLAMLTQSSANKDAALQERMGGRKQKQRRMKREEAREENVKGKGPSVDKQSWKKRRENRNLSKKMKNRLKKGKRRDKRKENR